MVRIANGLESLLGDRIRIAVQERREVVRTDALPHDVVILRAVVLEEPRLHPRWK